jgi:hypothetical protein
MLILCHEGLCESIAPFYFISFNPTIMETNIIERNLRQFHGTEEYHKHLFPGKSPLLLTDGCKYIRDDLKSYWLFDAILTYQNHKSLRDINFQIWELKQLKKDFTWLLTCREDTGKRPLISQSIMPSI